MPSDSTRRTRHSDPLPPHRVLPDPGGLSFRCRDLRIRSGFALIRNWAILPVVGSPPHSILVVVACGTETVQPRIHGCRRPRIGPVQSHCLDEQSVTPAVPDPVHFQDSKDSFRHDSCSRPINSSGRFVIHRAQRSRLSV